MANERVQKVLLQWEIEQRALRNVIQGNAQIRASLQQAQVQQVALANTSKQLEAAFAGIGRQKELDQLAAQFAQGKINADQLAAALDRMGDVGATEFRRVAAEATRLREEMEKAAATDALGQGRLFSGGRLQGGALGRLGSELRLLPSVPIPGTGFGTDSIANTLRITGALNTAMQAVGVTMQQMAAATGILGAAFIAVKIVADQFNATLDTGRRALTNAIEAQKRYFDLLETFTSRQAQAMVVQLQASQALLQTQIDAAENSLNATRRAIVGGGASNVVEAGFKTLILAQLEGGVFGALADSATPLGPLTAHLEELQGQYDEQDALIQQLIAGLQGAAFAGNDYNAALEANRNLLREVATAEIERAAQIDRLLASGSREQIEELIRAEETRIAVARSEIAHYEDMIAAGGDYHDELIAQQDAVILAANALQDYNAVLQQVIASEKARNAAEEAKRDTERATRLTETFEEQQAEAIQRNIDRLNELQLAFNQAESDAALRLGEQQADALTKRNDALSDIDLKAADRRADLEDKYQEDREDALAKHNQRLKEIEEDFRKDFRTAVAERDALAAFQAKEERDKLVKRENERFALQQAEREKDFERQRKELEENLQAQRDQRQREYERQLRDLQTNFDRDKALRQTKYQRDIEQQQRAFANQQALRQAQYNAEYNALAQHVQNLINLQKQLVGFSQTYFSKGTGEFGTGVVGVKGFATGIDRVPFTMPAILHKDETVLNPRQAAAYRAMQGSTGGVNVWIQFDGKTLRATSRAQALGVVREVFEKAGIA